MLKPALEQLALTASGRSFRFFHVETHAFMPYWHYHPEIELTLITKGKGTRFIGDSIMPFTDLDLVLIGENLPHHWVSGPASEGSSNEAYVFQFDHTVFGHFPECSVFEELFVKARKGVHFTSPNGQVIELIKSFETKSKIAQLASLLELLQLLMEDKAQSLVASGEYFNTYSNYGAQLKIAKTTNYILAHLDQKLTVGQMSEFAHMVPQSFCRWFKSHSGHSFVSFLNQTRIQRASHLLLSTNMPIQEIAFSCGFESLSHFNRTFKKVKMQNPSAFKLNNMV